jgi:guanylate kinase
MSGSGLLVVISGPSGAGKTTLCEKLLELSDLRRVVTCTTRPPRPGEVDGIDYRFLDRKEFQRRIAEGKFLEHAEFLGHLYGTPREEVEAGIERDEILLLNIDVQGARQLRDAGLEKTTSIFVEAPDLKTLEERLKQRRADSYEEVQNRLKRASEELEEKVHYDHVVVNDKIDQAAREVLAFLSASPKTT